MKQPRPPQNNEEFSEALSEIIATCLRQWQHRLHFEAMRALDLGCFPWHGYLELSFLTTQEMFEETEDNDKWENIGDWRWYNFNEECRDWEEFKHLTQWIRGKWYQPEKEREAEIEPLFEASARALSSPPVIQELRNYLLTPDFQLSVFHPDYSGTHNYCHPFLTEDSWIKVIKPIRTA